MFGVQLPYVLGTIALVLHVIGYVWYGLDTIRDGRRPNIVTWTAWLIGGLVEFWTFTAIEGTHWSESMLPAVCAASVLVIWCLTVYQQYFKKAGASGTYYPDGYEWTAASFDVFAGLLWLWKGMAAAANSIAVWSSVFTFWPTYKSTWLEAYNERPGPWIVWCCAYTVMAVVVIIEQGGFLVWQMVYPGSYLFMHALVPFVYAISPNKVNPEAD